MNAKGKREGHAARLARLVLTLQISTVAAGAATLYVSPTGSNTPPYTNWTTAARAIQTAINAATNGDTVRVGPATYTLAAAVNISRGVSLVGDQGAVSTILHGPGTTNCVRMTHTGAVLRGFTVRNGRARNGGGIYLGAYGVVEECTVSNNVAGDYGGGLYLATNALVRNCTISSNFADWCGGGIYFYAGGRIEDTAVLRNFVDGYGGGLYFEGNNRGKGAVATRLMVAGNVADWEYGGGVCGWDYSDAVIEDSTFVTNRSVALGGGIYLCGGGAVRRCKLFGNRADDYGGGIYADYIAAVESCLIAGNWAGSYGGGVYIYQTPMWNLTIVGNQSDQYAGGIYTTPSVPLCDSIVTGNTAPSYPNVEGVSAEYCCIDPPPAGTGNFAGPPGFADAGAGDYRLATNSPCLDAGSPAGFPARDLDGVSRGLDGNNDGVARNDVGAYELLHSAADSDRDGLTDQAEIATYHTDPADPDSDDDRQSDGDEQIAGTDPNNPARWFCLAQCELRPATGLVLAWWSVTGRVYSVRTASDLAAGNWLPAPGGADLPGTGGWMSYSFNPDGAGAFVRLEVRRAD